MAFIINAFQRCKALGKLQTPVNEACVSTNLIYNFIYKTIAHNN